MSLRAHRHARRASTNRWRRPWRIVEHPAVAPVAHRDARGDERALRCDTGNLLVARDDDASARRAVGVIARGHGGIPIAPDEVLLGDDRALESVVDGIYAFVQNGNPDVGTPPRD